MRRKLLNVAAAVSLVLFVATAALWPLSYIARPAVSRAGWSKHEVAADRGSVQIYTVSRHTFRITGTSSSGLPVIAPNDDEQFAYTQSPIWQFAWRRNASTPRWVPASRTVGLRALAPLQGGDAPHSGMIVGEGFEVSLWLLVLLSAILPAIWLKQRSRLLAAHRIARGLCPSCGYDVRATPGRCPECGEPPHNPPMQRTGGKGILEFASRLCAGR